MNKTNQAQAPAIAEIEWDSVEGGNTEFEVKYPRMQWVHGEAKASGFMKTGGLFISSEEYPNFSGEGFEPSKLITDDNTEIEGYAASVAQIAVIRIKHQWVKDEGRNVPLVHALVMVKGCDDPICISLRGATKALDFQKAFNQHMAHNIALANRTRPQTASALEPFALWFPVTAGAYQTVSSKDGKNKSTVTPPSLSSPSTLDRNYVVTLWVGAEKYKQFVAFFKETAAWQKTPIWEQREADAPEFSGDERATEEQFQHFVNICTAKDLNETEIVGQATKGVTTDFMQLSKVDARALIDGLAKL